MQFEPRYPAALSSNVLLIPDIKSEEKSNRLNQIQEPKRILQTRAMLSNNRKKTHLLSTYHVAGIVLDDLK